MSILFGYHIPPSIKERISADFLTVLGEECAKTFDFDSPLERDDHGMPLLYYVTGTAGWVQALRVVCRQFDMSWLFDYWNRLDWCESDLFDDELSSEIIRQFEKGECS